MSLSDALISRSESKCELCGSSDSVVDYLIPPKRVESVENQVVVCGNCHAQIQGDEELNNDHWRCLNESMWNEHLPVQVMAYRMLTKLNSQDWAQDLIGMMYLEEDQIEWALWEGDAKVVHKDINGKVLKAGDSVTLVKDLNVKGGGFTAKQGVSVRRIRLDPNNANYIEGKVDGQDIVILTEYVKKN